MTASASQPVSEFQVRRPRSIEPQTTAPLFLGWGPKFG
jgi:hypothetical protein